MVTLVYKEKKPFKYKTCNYSCIKKPNLNQHNESVHELKNLVKLKNFAQDTGLNKHIVTVNKGKKPFKYHRNFAQETDLSNHIKTVHEGKKPFKCKTCNLHQET